jgi:NADP-dependent 3-hydroxy acid dehydrogenase YdfG
MATFWGAWKPEERHTPHSQQRYQPDGEALPADQVAEFIAWIVASPSSLVLNQVRVTPLHERGWP